MDVNRLGWMIVRKAVRSGVFAKKRHWRRNGLSYITGRVVTVDFLNKRAISS